MMTKNSFKKTMTLILVMLLTLPMCFGCDTHFHDYSDATCTEPKRCACGEVAGDPLGHDYSDATCTDAPTCSRCGKMSGQALGHVYTGTPTCTDAQTCSRCGEASGSVLGHAYTDATCTAPKKCTRCGVTAGSSLGHSYASATCTSPQLCVRCGEGKGAPLGHNYASATCDQPKICTRCDKTDGSPLGHLYADDYCIRCKQVDPDTLPVGLEEMHIISSENAEYLAGIYTDTYGYTYNGGFNYYAWMSYYNCFSMHNLKREFETFSGSFVAGQSMETNATIEIYVDGVLKHRITDFTRETEKIDFTVDVKNASTLKIVVSGGGDREVALVNAKLYR